MVGHHQRHTTTRHGPAPSPPQVPDQQRASDASLLRRLEAATARNRQLEAEVRELKDQLARALGQQRAAAVTSSGETSSPRQRSAKTIGPC
jgi:hypothetical protein